MDKDKWLIWFWNGRDNLTGSGAMPYLFKGPAGRWSNHSNNSLVIYGGCVDGVRILHVGDVLIVNKRTGDYADNLKYLKNKQ